MATDRIEPVEACAAASGPISSGMRRPRCSVGRRNRCVRVRSYFQVSSAYAEASGNGCVETIETIVTQTRSRRCTSSRAWSSGTGHRSACGSATRRSRTSPSPSRTTTRGHVHPRAAPTRRRLLRAVCEREEGARDPRCSTGVPVPPAGRSRVGTAASRASTSTSSVAMRRVSATSRRRTTAS